MFLYSEWFHVYIVTELIRTSDSAIHALEKRNFIQGKVALRGEGNIVVLEKKISCKSSFIFIVVWNTGDYHPVQCAVHTVLRLGVTRICHNLKFRYVLGPGD